MMPETTLYKMSVLISIIKYGYELALKNASSEDKIYVLLQKDKKQEDLISEYNRMKIVLKTVFKC